MVLNGWRAWLIAVSIIGLPPLAASAADLKGLIGRWRWQAFTIEVSECRGDSVCAKVVAGPKNVGMEVFASKLSPKGGDWFGQITLRSKQVYDMISAEVAGQLASDGCTA
jgi:hypothetical protein